MDNHAPTPSRTDAISLLAARLANTGQVLGAWARATGSSGDLLRQRLERAARELDLAVGALTATDEDFKHLDERGETCAIGAMNDGDLAGLRGHSEMIGLVEFIDFLSNLGKDGVLQAQTDDESYIVEMRSGDVVYVSAEPLAPEWSLGAILVQQEAVTAEDLERGMQAAAEHEFLGEVLIRLNLLKRPALVAALTEQATMAFVSMHRVGTGFRFQFEEDARYIEEPEIKLGTSRLLLESARLLDEMGLVEANRVADAPACDSAADEAMACYREHLAARVKSGDLEVPVLPDATGQLLALCWADEFDPGELMKCVNRDQALSAHLLRVANSAAYAPATPISSTRIAIARLGLDALRQVTLALTLKQRIFQLPGWESVVKSLWRSAALTGGFGGVVGKSCGAGAVRGSMVGLLLDIGKPIVLNALHQIDGEVEAELTPKIAEQLMEEFHGPIGEMLAEDWALPDWLAGVMQHHHDYSESTEFRLEAMVGNLACTLTRWVDSMEEIEAESIPELEVCSDLGLDSRTVQEILTNAERILEMARVYA